MDFKEAIKSHFKCFEASPMLFVGSGMSRRYLGLENWEQLLLKFCEEIGENPLRMRANASGNLPRYAKLLADAYNTKWWSGDSVPAIAEEYKEHFTSDSSVLKIEISRYLVNAHASRDAELLEELQILASTNIDGIITTNWDCLLEHLFPKFTTFIGQDGLIAGRSHGIAEIYKIHGCSSVPNSLVLTEADYEEYRRKNPYLSSKLLTIFIERPVIFLGYSLTDPHIAEILDDIISCFPEKSLEFLKDKLIFVSWDGDLEEPSITDSVIHKKIPVKLIKLKSFIPLFEVLRDTKKRIPAHIFRAIKDELYDLVITDDPKGQLYVRLENDLEKSNLMEFVVGYGAISTAKKGEAIARQGLIGLERADLIRDVIFETGSYDAADVVSTVFPTLAKGNQRVPVFHYLKKAGMLSESGTLMPGVELCDGVKSRALSTIETFRSKGYELRRSKAVPEVLIGAEALYQQGFELFLRMIPYMDPSLLTSDLPELSEILKKHIDKSGNDSNFVRLVCIYDLIKNSSKYG
jgi:hypothetical protein